MERRKQNKVEGSTILIKAARQKKKGKEEGLVSRACIYHTHLSKNHFCNLPNPIPIPVVPLLGHNVLSSTYVVEVGQILFFINQTLQMILMVLVMVVD